jgi:hypothetical protein
LVAATGGYALATAVTSRLGPRANGPVASVAAPPVVVEKVVPAEPEVSTAPPPSTLGSAPAVTSATVPEPSQSGMWPVQDLELPADVTVQPDRGLLEIDVGAPHSIYVDGVFIGRGPARRIPLREGSHEVRVRGDGVDAVQSIAVRKARRTRLGPTNPQ